MATQSRFDRHILIDNRQVRIFLSSTFSDMQEERTALLKTFDALHVKAHRRNVDLTVLDLRWGVTDEEARSGKVISVCLNEIEHSHPFFIGLLGSRYGYAPEAGELDKSPDLLERYPWLADDIAARRSITEMEMLYGVLRNENDVDAAFYIRQNGTPDDDPRQTALKERIRGQQRYPVADYASVDELCTMVEREVTTMLDRHFPDVEATPLERERTAHRAYANSLLGHFVGRDEELGWLDDFVRSAERHLVVTGESGMGKSALLARWCRQHEESDDFNLVYHFVGNSLGSSSYEGILRHLCDEIYYLYCIDKVEGLTHNGRPEKPEEEAQRLVAEVGRRSQPLVVVIDGINQLSAPMDEKLLLWLPAANAQVRFIFTTLQDDDTMRTFERRGYSVRTLHPLTDGQRRRFAEGYLERVGKHLNSAQWKRIMDDPETQNTLVLRTLLDELICFGSHERLDTRIDFYLAAQGIEDFFDHVLQRMEETYNNGQDLVRHTLTLLALSEHGLREKELLAITGFRQIDWNLFYCAFFNHLVVRNGIITFSHHYVAAAVNHRYIIDDAVTITSYCREIIDLFDKQPISNRRTSELAHQYYYIKDWDGLHNTILCHEAFYYLNNSNPSLLSHYWSSLLNTMNPKYSLANYINLDVNKKYFDLSIFHNDVGLFIAKYFSDYQLALKYVKSALSFREKTEYLNSPAIANSYNNIGYIHEKNGEYSLALDFFLKAVSIREKILGYTDRDTMSSYINIGYTYSQLGLSQKAMDFFYKALRINQTLGENSNETARLINNIGELYLNNRVIEEALSFFFTALNIWKKNNGEINLDTATAYNNIGVAYSQKGELDNAKQYFETSLSILERIVAPIHPIIATTLNNLSTIYFELEQYEKALEYSLRDIEICKKTIGEKHPDTAISYSTAGMIFHKIGDQKNALLYLEKSLKINEKSFNPDHQTTQELRSLIEYIKSIL